MQSPTVKRVASVLLAAVAAITITSLAPVPATATPRPAPQTPPAGSSAALAKYRELAGKAERLNEDYLKAKDDLTAKQRELNTANSDLAAAKRVGEKAASDKKRYQREVNKFAGASFTGAAQLTKLSTLLSGGSTQEFLDRSSALAILSNDRNDILKKLSAAAQDAINAQQQSEDAQHRAQAAKDSAAKLANDISARKKSLDDQIRELEIANGLLDTVDHVLQQDIGLSIPNIKAPGPAAQAAVDAALSKLGSDYVWGATGPSTFDCSGLTSWAYQQAGISIPRSSRSQSVYGVAIPYDKMEPGDLVFFYSPVSHVGMYLGNGRMVHAPTSGDVVKISSLQSQFSGARRMA